MKAFLFSLLLLSIFPLPAHASPGAPEEGFDYRLIEPASPVKPGKKVEVIEFFWYDCPHCNAMLPLIEPWARRHGSSIKFIRIPFARNDSAVPQQHLYYALQALGKSEALHEQIFHAIHNDKILLKTAEQMAEYLEKQGIARNLFLKTYHSASVRAKVQQAQKMAQLYRIDSVPTMIVDNRFITSATMLGGNQADALQVLEYLVDKASSRQP